MCGQEYGTPVRLLDDVVVGVETISCGAEHMAAIDGLGRLWMWGAGERFGETPRLTEPPALPPPAGEDGAGGSDELGTVELVACGNGTVLAVTDGGSAYMWGEPPSPQRLDALSTPDVRVQMVACAKGVVEEEDGAPLVLTLAAPEAPSAFSEQFDRYYRAEASHQDWQQSAPLL